MKCHAGVEFPPGTPCPRCNAKLGEVCWPGINADLLQLPKLREALEKSRDAIRAVYREIDNPSMPACLAAAWERADAVLGVQSR